MSTALVWDAHLDARGAQLTRYTPRPGSTFYQLVRGEWRDENQGPPAILIDVLDEQGKRLLGVPVHCFNGGESIHFTEAKPNDRWATDFPMFNVGCAYRIEVGPASDKVGCLGLGSIADPNHAHHSGYLFVFQRTTAGTEGLPPGPVIPPEPPLPPTLDPILDALGQARQAIDTAMALYSRQIGRRQ